MTAKKQTTLGQQIERARTIVNSWPPEKLAKMQLQGTDIYLERARVVQTVTNSVDANPILTSYKEVCRS